MASIGWTDSVGAAVLSNGLPAPADRFRDWVPKPVGIGPVHHALGSGTRHTFRFRRDRGATFALEEIPHTSLDLIYRLIEHLDDGGTVTVTTGDAAARVYVAQQSPESALPVPEYDRRMGTYRCRFDLMNTGAERMLCIYP